MDEEVNLGLLGIGLSDSDDASASDEVVTVAKVDRNAQSEEAFQQVRSEYRVKVENGEVRIPAHLHHSMISHIFLLSF